MNFDVFVITKIRKEHLYILSGYPIHGKEKDQGRETTPYHAISAADKFYDPLNVLTRCQSELNLDLMKK
jgi:hypothetical protein